MRRVALMRAPRAICGCLAVLVLATTLAACSTSSTVFGGNQSPLTGSIVLIRSTVVAGHLVRAELVLHNSSGHVIVLDRGCPHGFVALVLTRGRTTTGDA